MEPELAFFESQKLLIMDDDPLILNLTVEFIKTLGLDFCTASDGQEAIELLKKIPFTIVITDLKMPKLDGLELLGKIKSEWPGTDIIAMTGYAKEFPYVTVIKAGASDYIEKPFKLDEFKAKINRIIRERNLRALLKKLSLKDPLTDLYNRRFFEAKIEEDAKCAIRQQFSLFLIMVDLDDFKMVNDRKGHQIGDQILKYLANTLTSYTRHHTDIVCRYGGDEFIATISKTTPEQTFKIAERIRSKFLEGDNLGTTISIGISEFRRTDRPLMDDLYTLIREADEAMYFAKKNGGNQVFLHPAIPQKVNIP